MLVVLFGASGFLGKTIDGELSAQNHHVIRVSSQGCNLLNSDAVHSFFSMRREAFHLILCAAVKRTVADSFSSFLDNIHMMENLKSICAAQIRSIIYTSTTDVYGHHPMLPISETSPTHPSTYYALSKLICEYFARKFFSVPLSILRLPGFFGQHDHGFSVVGRIKKQLLETGHVQITGDGEQRRDYILAEDIAKLIGSLLKQPYDGIVNIASGVSLSLREWVFLIAKTLNIHPEIRFEPKRDKEYDLLFDVSLLRKLFPALRCREPSEAIPAYLSLI